jgi:hypothetical protein
MKQAFKHPQIFADVLTLMQLYYPLHQSLPRPFRFAVGELILQELAQMQRHIVLANAVDKTQASGRASGAGHVRRVRAGVEVVRGYMLLAWKLRMLAHMPLADLSARLEAIARQACRWQQWFEGGAAPSV